MGGDRPALSDLAKLAATVCLGGITALTPRAARGPLVTRLAAAGSRVRRQQLDAMAELLAARLPDKSGQERRQIAIAMRAVRIEQAMCRGYGVFRCGWPGEVHVTGAEHLRAARSSGRGVVVWLMTFLDTTPLNLAAAAEGYPVTHLTSPRHGIRSNSTFSRRVAAPILLRGERRSQDRRVTIPESGGFGYLRELRSVIEVDHGLVTIRGDYTTGRRMIEAPCLEGIAKFPTGAPALAYLTGAPLLTAATTRRGPFLHDVIIDDPIPVARSLSRGAFQHAAIQEFASRLDQRSRDNPESLPWLYMQGGHYAPAKGT